MTTVYLLPYVGRVDYEEAESAFRYEACSICSLPQRIQVNDLRLRLRVPPVRPVMSTFGGDLLAPPAAFSALKTSEAEVSSRPVSIADVSGQWLQIVTQRSVELAEESLREPRRLCTACEGLTRPIFSDFPPLAIRLPSSRKVPVIAHVAGAPQLIILSSLGVDILQRFDPEFYAEPIRIEGDPMPGPSEWEHDWDWD